MKGFIYKIWSENGDKVYIGSTKKAYLSNRWADHRSKYRCKKGRRCSSYDLFDEYGLDNCKCTLLEKIEFNTLDELRIKEQEWIDKHIYCVNVIKSKPMSKEEENICKHNYYLSVKDTLEYKERCKLAREKYYPKRKEVITCECGVSYTKGHQSRHKKSNVHQAFLQK